jgi:hypothetical protein
MIWLIPLWFVLGLVVFTFVRPHHKKRPIYEYLVFIVTTPLVIVSLVTDWLADRLIEFFMKLSEYLEFLKWEI